MNSNTEQPARLGTACASAKVAPARQNSISFHLEPSCLGGACTEMETAPQPSAKSGLDSCKQLPAVTGKGARRRKKSSLMPVAAREKLATYSSQSRSLGGITRGISMPNLDIVPPNSKLNRESRLWIRHGKTTSNDVVRTLLPDIQGYIHQFRAVPLDFAVVSASRNKLWD